jgi:hypothetical protein
MTLYLRAMALTAGTVGAMNVLVRLDDGVEGSDRFAEHTNREHRKHPFSGMHSPLFPTEEQVEIMQTHFSKHLHMLPTSLDTFRKQQAIQTPVRLLPLSRCPIPWDRTKASIVAVGGPPALISAALEKKVVFIRDSRKHPASKGAANHIELDAPTEASTTYRPTQFIINQMYRTCFGYVSLKSVEKTGHFPWRTLDWTGWIKHPLEWPTGIRVAALFQKETMKSGEAREEYMAEVAEKCRKSEAFYNRLNEELSGRLLSDAHGSYYMARNPSEAAELSETGRLLKKEGRSMVFMTSEEFCKSHGFTPQAELVGKKTHDRVISADYESLIGAHLEHNGGSVIDGALLTVYSDEKSNGGIIEYRKNGSTTSEFLPFSKLLLSLGSQPILDSRGNSLFDLVCARGVSTLAFIYVPQEQKLPPLVVCGDTNHVTTLEKQTNPIQGEDGKLYHRYLVRMTSAACITPNSPEEDSAHYDASTAVGLVAAVRKTLGFKVEMIIAYGCNRFVSQYGETRWHKLHPDIAAQVGAGGGGFTRGSEGAEFLTSSN